MLFLYSCKKSNSESSVNSTMNTTERQLVGTWKVTSEADTTIVNGKVIFPVTTTYTPSGTTAPFIQFTNKQYSTLVNYFMCNDAARLGTFPNDHYIYYTPEPLSWYYDTTKHVVQIEDGAYSIVSLTSNALVLKQIISIDTLGTDEIMYDVIYFQKQ